MKTVCVIDDDAAFQKMMNHHLTNMGFVVRSIFSGREMDHIQEQPFAVLLDHFLEEEDDDGLGLLRKLKTRYPDVAVIYMTSHADARVRDAARKSGVFDFIEKNPASLVRLRSALDAIALRQEKSNWFTRIFGKRDPARF
jgi:DNA-binding NtrC family response regulator